MRFFCKALIVILVSASAYSVARADSGLSDLLGLSDSELILRPTPSITLSPDGIAKIDSQGNYHYFLKAKYFSPAIDIVNNKNLPKNELFKLLGSFVDASRKWDCKAIESLYSPETRTQLDNTLKEPAFAKQFAGLKRFAVTLIVEIQGRCFVYSLFDSTAAALPGYTPVVVTQGNGLLQLEAGELNEKESRPIGNFAQALQYGILDVQPKGK
jgi:hypothetical protein